MTNAKLNPSASLLPEGFMASKNAALSPTEGIEIALTLSSSSPDTGDAPRLARVAVAVPRTQVEDAARLGATPGELADHEYYTQLAPEVRLRRALAARKNAPNIRETVKWTRWISTEQACGSEDPKE